jgi:Insertion element 4 transposase N-terminal/Transposase DDE domain
MKVPQESQQMPLSSVLKFIPMERVKDALCMTGRNDCRERDMPNRQTVYFTIAMSLFSASSYQDVLRNLRNTVDLTEGYSESAKILAKSAISNARQRLGYEPLQELFKAVVAPIAISGKTKGAFAFGRRVVAIDGTLLAVPDTPENAEQFPRSSTATGPCAYPQVRLVALIECGTRILFDYEMTNGKKVSEKALARELLPRLQKGQLCIADRLYSDYKT